MVGSSFDPHCLLQDRLLLIDPHPHSHFYLLVKGSIKRASQVALVVKNSPANVGDIRDVGLISGLGRSPGGGNGNPFPFLPGKSMDRGAWWATVPGMAKSLTQLSNWARKKKHSCPSESRASSEPSPGLRFLSSPAGGTAHARAHVCIHAQLPPLPNTQAELFTIAKARKQPKCPSTEEWVKTMYICCIPYIWRNEKEWNNAICSNMDGPRDFHTKWSKSDRGRQIPCDITYMWNF